MLQNFEQGESYHVIAYFRNAFFISSSVAVACKDVAGQSGSTTLGFPVQTQPARFCLLRVNYATGERERESYGDAKDLSGLLSLHFSRIRARSRLSQLGVRTGLKAMNGCRCGRSDDKQWPVRRLMAARQLLCTTPLHESPEQLPWPIENRAEATSTIFLQCKSRRRAV